MRSDLVEESLVLGYLQGLPRREVPPNLPPNRAAESRKQRPPPTPAPPQPHTPAPRPRPPSSPSTQLRRAHTNRCTPLLSESCTASDAKDSISCTAMPYVAAFKRATISTTTTALWNQKYQQQ